MPARKKPSKITIRHVAGDGSGEEITLDELRRRIEAKREREAREPYLLAMRLGQAFTVTTDSEQMWWFVIDVEGMFRTVTGKTLLFEMPYTRTFSFDLVKLLKSSPDIQGEANRWRRKLALPEIYDADVYKDASAVAVAA